MLVTLVLLRLGGDAGERQMKGNERLFRKNAARQLSAQAIDSKQVIRRGCSRRRGEHFIKRMAMSGRLPRVPLSHHARSEASYAKVLDPLLNAFSSLSY